MSSLTDSSAIFHYHRAMIKQHGGQSTYALGWRDEESQLSRFSILAAIDDINGCSVLDAGCGYADLLPYLQTIYPNIGHYCGIEQIPELLDEAIKRYGNLPDVSFISGNFITRNLPVMDYILASGSLNYASSDPQFIFKAIDKLYHNCNKGVAFNLLRTVPVNGLLVAYNPQMIMDYCHLLSDKVILKDGYADEDFTVFMYH
ncbi:MAG: class I SAM-dependent methyltransferase [Bacteroidota bacterium]